MKYIFKVLKKMFMFENNSLVSFKKKSTWRKKASIIKIKHKKNQYIKTLILKNNIGYSKI